MPVKIPPKELTNLFPATFKVKDQKGTYPCRNSFQVNARLIEGDPGVKKVGEYIYKVFGPHRVAGTPGGVRPISYRKLRSPRHQPLKGDYGRHN